MLHQGVFEDLSFLACKHVAKTLFLREDNKLMVGKWYDTERLNADQMCSETFSKNIPGNSEGNYRH